MKPHLPIALRSALLAALAAVSFTAYSPAWAEENALTETHVYANGTWSQRITGSKILDDYELVDISNKSGTRCGEAIYLSSSSDEVTISNSGKVIFSDNSASSNAYNSPAIGDPHGDAPYGEAICSYYGTLSFTDNGDITFSGNSASNGGAIYNQGTLCFTGNRDISFLGNSASSGDSSNGGAIYNKGELSFTDNEDISFSDNSTSSYGGAIYNEGELSFTDNGNSPSQATQPPPPPTPMAGRFTTKARCASRATETSPSRATRHPTAARFTTKAR